MVTARYLTNKFVKPVIEKHEARGRVEGRVEGQVEERRKWIEWNTRRLEAEKSGQHFDEPPPAS
jgi:predicted transposase YdaD